MVDVYAKEYNLDSKLILALISKESSFRPNAVSSSGAVGLGQLLKQTAKDMGIKDPYNPEENIKATTKYLSILIKKWNGNINLALASYKIGHGNVTRLVKAGDELPLSTKKYIKEIITAQSKI
ncbi:MAG: lytic transglycosylase domain-containing protein [Candidatus Sericytochromatia bacterium]